MPAPGFVLSSVYMYMCRNYGRAENCTSGAHPAGFQVHAMHSSAHPQPVMRMCKDQAQHMARGRSVQTNVTCLLCSCASTRSVTGPLYSHRLPAGAYTMYVTGTAVDSAQNHVAAGDRRVTDMFRNSRLTGVSQGARRVCTDPCNRPAGGCYVHGKVPCHNMSICWICAAPASQPVCGCYPPGKVTAYNLPGYR
jgi:hypothetical protein